MKVTTKASPENDTTLTFFDNCSLDSLEYSDEMRASSLCLWSCYLLLGTSYCWVTVQQKTEFKKNKTLKHRNEHCNLSWYFCVLVVYLFFYKSSLLKELPVLLQHPLLHLQSLQNRKEMRRTWTSINNINLKISWKGWLCVEITFKCLTFLLIKDLCGSVLWLVRPWPSTLKSSCKKRSHILTALITAPVISTSFWESTAI